MDRSPFAPAPTRREEATAGAWRRYRDTLADLTGAEYERAEPDAWDELQRELADIERSS